MANPMRMLIFSFLLLAGLSFSTLADTSTVKTSSKDQVACQTCPADNPPPPPPVVLCPPPPSPPPPPPPPEDPLCPPPPPPTCHECLPCLECKPDAVPAQPRVMGGTAYASPSSASGTVPYLPYYNLNASTSNIRRRLFDVCSAISLLLATILCFF